jgi:hypothetical protein
MNPKHGGVETSRDDDQAKYSREKMFEPSTLRSHMISCQKGRREDNETEGK